MILDSVLSVKVILFSELDNGSQRLTCLITKAVNLICYLKAHYMGGSQPLMIREQLNRFISTHL